MVDYKNGKIYKLYVDNLVYIGSTAQPTLTIRLRRHKSAYKQWVKTEKCYVSSIKLFKVGTPTMELIELFPCGSKVELLAREGFHQKSNVCVNKLIAGRTAEDYYQANRTHVLERIKTLNANNKRIERLTLFIQKHIQSIS